MYWSWGNPQKKCHAGLCKIMSTSSNSSALRLFLEIGLPDWRTDESFMYSLRYLVISKPWYTKTKRSLGLSSGSAVVWKPWIHTFTSLTKPTPQLTLSRKKIIPKTSHTVFSNLSRSPSSTVLAFIDYGNFCMLFRGSEFSLKNTLPGQEGRLVSETRMHCQSKEKDYRLVTALLHSRDNRKG